MLMSILKRTWAIFSFVARRLLSQRWFVLAALLGLVASVVLLMSIPLYADSVYHRIFRSNLLEERSATNWHRPAVVRNGISTESSRRTDG